MKLKNIFLSLICVMMTGCTNMSRQSESRNVETTNTKSTAQGQVLKTLFKGNVTMELFNYDYDKSQKAFSVQTRIRNNSYDEADVDYEQCNVNGYQVPLHMNIEEVNGRSQTTIEAKILISDLNKAGIKLNKVQITFVIEKEDDQKIRESITIPLKKFAHYKTANKAYKKVKKTNKVLFHAKKVKAIMDRYYYDRNEDEYVMQVTIANKSSRPIELKANNINVNGHRIELDEEDNDVLKGKKRVAEYRIEADDLKGVNLRKTGGKVTFVLEDDQKEHVILARKTVKIPGSYFKS